MSRTERLVLDVNVVISAMLIVPSTASRVLEHAIAHCRVVLTNQTRRELVATVTSAKFDRYVPQEKRHAVLMRLESVIDPVVVIQVVRACRDPHDDAVLEAALNGRADVIVTGDKDLLALNPFRGIAIMTPVQYLQRIEAARDDSGNN
jgi:putative PIN family toxin of toxin-antitoxin system